MPTRPSSGTAEISSTSSGKTTTVHVSITIQTPEPEPPADTEWLVVDDGAAPTLAAAVRDRLAAKLTSRKTSRSAKDRVCSAFQCGVNSRALNLADSDLLRPPATGLQNSCWLAVQIDYTVLCATRYRDVTKQLKAAPTTRVVAFASQAEAEAWCLGFGLDALPSPL